MSNKTMVIIGLILAALIAWKVMTNHHEVSESTPAAITHQPANNNTVAEHMPTQSQPSVAPNKNERVPSTDKKDEHQEVMLM